MKILVIDDSKNHRDSAVQTLAGHDLAVCSSYDEATKLLEVKYPGDDGTSKYGYRPSEGEKSLPYWDAVLCDLLMPASDECQCDNWSGQEMPVGWSLALVAASRGAKFVAVVTDMNHHKHPASAMLDRIYKHTFVVDGAKMILTNDVATVGIKGTENTCPQCNGTKRCGCEDGGAGYECYGCRPEGIYYKERGKDWGFVLELLQK